VERKPFCHEAVLKNVWQISFFNSGFASTKVEAIHEAGGATIWHGCGCSKNSSDSGFSYGAVCLVELKQFCHKTILKNIW
jgi:hypothetical protein